MTNEIDKQAEKLKSLLTNLGILSEKSEKTKEDIITEAENLTNLINVTKERKPVWWNSVEVSEFERKNKIRIKLNCFENGMFDGMVYFSPGAIYHDGKYITIKDLPYAFEFTLNTFEELKIKYEGFKAKLIADKEYEALKQKFLSNREDKISKINIIDGLELSWSLDEINALLKRHKVRLVFKPDYNKTREMEISVEKTNWNTSIIANPKYYSNRLICKTDSIKELEKIIITFKNNVILRGRENR